MINNAHYIGNGIFHSVMPREISPIYSTTLVVFIQIFTATHAIMHTNLT